MAKRSITKAETGDWRAPAPLVAALLTLGARQSEVARFGAVEIGLTLAELRLALGLTQEDVAGRAGLSLLRLNEIEAAMPGLVKVAELELLCDVFESRPDKPAIARLKVRRRLLQLRALAEAASHRVADMEPAPEALAPIAARLRQLANECRLSSDIVERAVDTVARLVQLGIEPATIEPGYFGGSMLVVQCAPVGLTTFHLIDRFDETVGAASYCAAVADRNGLVGSVTLMFNGDSAVGREGIWVVPATWEWTAEPSKVSLRAALHTLRVAAGFEVKDMPGGGQVVETADAVLGRDVVARWTEKCGRPQLVADLLDVLGWPRFGTAPVGGEVFAEAPEHIEPPPSSSPTQHDSGAAAGAGSTSFADDPLIRDAPAWPPTPWSPQGPHPSGPLHLGRNENGFDDGRQFGRHADRHRVPQGRSTASPLRTVIDADLELFGPHLFRDQDGTVLIQGLDAVHTVILRTHTDSETLLRHEPRLISGLTDHVLSVAAGASPLAAGRAVARGLEAVRAVAQYDLPVYATGDQRPVMTVELMSRFAELRYVIARMEQNEAQSDVELLDALDEVSVGLGLVAALGSVTAGPDTRAMLALLDSWDPGARLADRFAALIRTREPGVAASASVSVAEPGIVTALFQRLIRRDRLPRQIEQTLPPPGGLAQAMEASELIGLLDDEHSLIGGGHATWDRIKARFRLFDVDGNPVDVTIWLNPEPLAEEAEIHHLTEGYVVLLPAWQTDRQLALHAADAVAQVQHQLRDGSSRAELLGRRAHWDTQTIAGRVAQLAVLVRWLDQAASQLVSAETGVLRSHFAGVLADLDKWVSGPDMNSWSALMASENPLLAEKVVHWRHRLGLSELAREQVVQGDSVHHRDVHDLGPFHGSARPPDLTDLSDREARQLVGDDVPGLGDSRVRWTGRRFEVTDSYGNRVNVLLEVGPLPLGAVASLRRPDFGSGWTIRLSRRAHSDDVSQAVWGALAKLVELHNPWASGFWQLQVVVGKYDPDGDPSEHQRSRSKLLALAADLGLRPSDVTWTERIAQLTAYDEVLASRFRELISELVDTRVAVVGGDLHRPNSVLSIRMSALTANARYLTRRRPSGVVGEVWELAPVESAKAMLKGGVKILHAPFLMALQLRAAGIKAEVITTALTLDRHIVAAAVESDLAVPVSSLTQLQLVESVSELLGKPVKVTVEVDTGRHWGGFTVRQFADLQSELGRLVKAGRIRYSGVFTELAHGDEAWHPMNDRQIEAFLEARLLARDVGPEDLHFHIAGTAMAARPDLAEGALARLGAPLYGMGWPGAELENATVLWGRVVRVRDVSAGRRVGYGGVPTDEHRRIAWIGLGYADGLPDTLGSPGAGEVWVNINGARCRAAGAVNMDMLPVEVPPGVDLADGDLALIAGPGLDGELTFPQLADALNVNVEQLLTAPHGRTLEVFHDGTELQAPRIFARSPFGERLAAVWARTDMAALRHNVGVVLARVRANLALHPELPIPRLMMVVKADGYGNNARAVAEAAAESGVDMIGVTYIDEALLLDAAGCTLPILAWETHPLSDFESAIRAGVAVGVGSAEVLSVVCAAATKVGIPAKIHLFVDTGLNREGFSFDELAAAIPAIQNAIEHGHVICDGVMSHMDHVPERWPDAVELFRATIALLADNGLHPPHQHLWPSHALRAPGDQLFTVIRAATSFFGYDPDFMEDPELLPVQTIGSSVAQVFSLAAGESVGTWTTARDTIVARVPIGFADLNLPAAGHPFTVTIDGRTYPCVGRPDRHAILVDLGPDSTVIEGTEVIVVGPGTLSERVLAGGGAGIFPGWGVAHLTGTAGDADAAEVVPSAVAVDPAVGEASGSAAGTRPVTPWSPPVNALSRDGRIGHAHRKPVGMRGTADDWVLYDSRPPDESEDRVGLISPRMMSPGARDHDLPYNDGSMSSGDPAEFDVVDIPGDPDLVDLVLETQGITDRRTALSRLETKLDALNEPPSAIRVVWTSDSENFHRFQELSSHGTTPVDVLRQIPDGQLAKWLAHRAGFRAMKIAVHGDRLELVFSRLPRDLLTPRDEYRQVTHEDWLDVLAMNERAMGADAYPDFAMRQLVDTWGEYCHIAKDETGVHGWIIAAVEPDTRQATILAHSVAPEDRELGHGNRLLEQLMAQLRGQGIRSVETLVPAGNEDAIRWYESRGFGVGPTLADPMRPGEDRVRMTRDLPSEIPDLITAEPAFIPESITVGDYTIRVMDPSRIHELHELDKAAFGADLAYPFHLLRQLVEAHGVSVVVVEDRQGRMVSYTMGAVRLDRHQMRVGVDAAGRRHLVDIIGVGSIAPGAGRLGMEYAIRTAYQRGIRSIGLQANPRNLRAGILYEKLGFRVVKEDPNYYGAGSRRFTMELHLELGAAQLSPENIDVTPSIPAEVNAHPDQLPGSNDDTVPGDVWRVMQLKSGLYNAYRELMEARATFDATRGELPSWAATDPEQLVRQVDTGEIVATDQQIANIRRYHIMTELYPELHENSRRLARNLGEWHYWHDVFEEAHWKIERGLPGSIEADPAVTGAHENLQGQEEEWIRRLDDPRHELEEAWLRRREAMEHLGRVDENIVRLDRALKLRLVESELLPPYHPLDREPTDRGADALIELSVLLPEGLATIELPEDPTQHMSGEELVRRTRRRATRLDNVAAMQSHLEQQPPGSSLLVVDGPPNRGHGSKSPYVLQNIRGMVYEISGGATTRYAPGAGAEQPCTVVEFPESAAAEDPSSTDDNPVARKIPNAYFLVHHVDNALPPLHHRQQMHDVHGSDGDGKPTSSTWEATLGLSGNVHDERLDAYDAYWAAYLDLSSTDAVEEAAALQRVNGRAHDWISLAMRVASLEYRAVYGGLIGGESAELAAARADLIYTGGWFAPGLVQQARLSGRELENQWSARWQQARLAMQSVNDLIGRSVLAIPHAPGSYIVDDQMPYVAPARHYHRFDRLAQLKEYLARQPGMATAFWWDFNDRSAAWGKEDGGPVLDLNGPGPIDDGRVDLAAPRQLSALVFGANGDPVLPSGTVDLDAASGLVSMLTGLKEFGPDALAVLSALVGGERIEDVRVRWVPHWRGQLREVLDQARPRFVAAGHSDWWDRLQEALDQVADLGVIADFQRLRPDGTYDIRGTVNLDGELWFEVNQMPGSLVPSSVGQALFSAMMKSLSERVHVLSINGYFPGFSTIKDVRANVSGRYAVNAGYSVVTLGELETFGSRREVIFTKPPAVSAQVGSSRIDPSNLNNNRFRPSGEWGDDPDSHRMSLGTAPERAALAADLRLVATPERSRPLAAANRRRGGVKSPWTRATVLHADPNSPDGRPMPWGLQEQSKPLPSFGDGGVSNYHSPGDGVHGVLQDGVLRLEVSAVTPAEAQARFEQLWVQHGGNVRAIAVTWVPDSPAAQSLVRRGSVREVGWSPAEELVLVPEGRLLLSLVAPHGFGAFEVQVDDGSGSVELTFHPLMPWLAKRIAAAEGALARYVEGDSARGLAELARHLGEIGVVLAADLSGPDEPVVEAYRRFRDRLERLRTELAGYLAKRHNADASLTGPNSSYASKKLPTPLTDRTSQSADAANQPPIAGDRLGAAEPGRPSSEGEDPAAMLLDAMERAGATHAEVAAALTLLWDYLRRDELDKPKKKWKYDPKRPPGAIVVLGSPDEGSAVFAVNFIREHGLTDIKVVFSGHKGEAARFAALAKNAGLRIDLCVEEPSATTTEENAKYSLDILNDLGCNMSNILVFTTPQHSRRTRNTFLKMGRRLRKMGRRLRLSDAWRLRRSRVRHVTVESVDVGVENYLRYGLRAGEVDVPTHPGKIVAAILREVRGLHAPTKAGYTRIPWPNDDIRVAYDLLTRFIDPDNEETGGVDILKRVYTGRVADHANVADETGPNPPPAPGDNGGRQTIPNEGPTKREVTIRIPGKGLPTATEESRSRSSSVEVPVGDRAALDASREIVDAQLRRARASEEVGTRALDVVTRLVKEVAWARLDSSAHVVVSFAGLGAVAVDVRVNRAVAAEQLDVWRPMVATATDAEITAWPSRGYLLFRLCFGPETDQTGLTGVRLPDPVALLLEVLDPTVNIDDIHSAGGRPEALSVLKGLRRDLGVSLKALCDEVGISSTDRKFIYKGLVLRELLQAVVDHSGGGYAARLVDAIERHGAVRRQAEAVRVNRQRQATRTIEALEQSGALLAEAVRVNRQGRATRTVEALEQSGVLLEVMPPQYVGGEMLAVEIRPLSLMTAEEFLAQLGSVLGSASYCALIVDDAGRSLSAQLVFDGEPPVGSAGIWVIPESANWTAKPSQLVVRLVLRTLRQAAGIEQNSLRGAHRIEGRGDLGRSAIVGWCERCGRPELAEAILEVFDLATAATKLTRMNLPPSFIELMLELRKFRIRAGLTIRELEEHVGNVSGNEFGRRVPEVSTIRTWVLACGGNEADIRRLSKLRAQPELEQLRATLQGARVPVPLDVVDQKVQLRRARLEAGLSYYELARRLGWSHDKANDTESGPRKLRPEEVRTWVRACGDPSSMAPSPATTADMDGSSTMATLRPADDAAEPPSQSRPLALENRRRGVVESRWTTAAASHAAKPPTPWTPRPTDRALLPRIAAGPPGLPDRQAELDHDPDGGRSPDDVPDSPDEGTAPETAYPQGYWSPTSGWSGRPQIGDLPGDGLIAPHARSAGGGQLGFYRHDPAGDGRDRLPKARPDGAGVEPGFIPPRDSQALGRVRDGLVNELHGAGAPREVAMRARETLSWLFVSPIWGNNVAARVVTHPADQGTVTVDITVNRVWTIPNLDRWRPGLAEAAAAEVVAWPSRGYVQVRLRFSPGTDTVGPDGVRIVDGTNQILEQFATLVKSRPAGELLAQLCDQVGVDLDELGAGETLGRTPTGIYTEDAVEILLRAAVARAADGPCAALIDEIQAQGGPRLEQARRLTTWRAGIRESVREHGLDETRADEAVSVLGDLAAAGCVPMAVESSCVGGQLLVVEISLSGGLDQATFLRRYGAITGACGNAATIVGDDNHVRSLRLEFFGDRLREALDKLREDGVKPAHISVKLAMRAVRLGAGINVPRMERDIGVNVAEVEFHRQIPSVATITSWVAGHDPIAPRLIELRAEPLLQQLRADLVRDRVDPERARLAVHLRRHRLIAGLSILELVDRLGYPWTEWVARTAEAGKRPIWLDEVAVWQRACATPPPAHGRTEQSDEVMTPSTEAERATFKAARRQVSQDMDALLSGISLSWYGLMRRAGMSKDNLTNLKAGKVLPTPAMVAALGAAGAQPSDVASMARRVLGLEFTKHRLTHGLTQQPRDLTQQQVATRADSTVRRVAELEDGSWDRRLTDEEVHKLVLALDAPKGTASKLLAWRDIAEPLGAGYSRRPGAEDNGGVAKQTGFAGAASAHAEKPGGPARTDVDDPFVSPGDGPSSGTDEPAYASDIDLDQWEALGELEVAPGAPEQIAVVRARVKAAVARQDWPDSAATDTVVLLASELATNILRHTLGGTVNAEITGVPGSRELTVVFADSIRQPPGYATPAQSAESSDESGRGFTILGELMAETPSLGYRMVIGPGGKTITLRLAENPSDPPTFTDGVVIAGADAEQAAVEQSQLLASLMLAHGWPESRCAQARDALAAWIYP
ncbi:GNAT family N-acetyltransferase, partial [Nocardia sp.]|uniref:GNAT family N-acetyltransferase n=1 Tax=Nocardia sp. TaxID=1821 RepID=UPI00263473C0